MTDWRGTGRSGGCLDHLGPKDARDLRDIVEWPGSQSWSHGRVGMTGHSYVGSTPSVAAAQNPPSFKTIVPSAGLASMYDTSSRPASLLPAVGGTDRGVRADRARAQDAAVAARPPRTGAAEHRRRLPQQHGGHRLWVAEQCRRRWRGPAVRPLRRLARHPWPQPRRDWQGPVFLVHGVNDDAAGSPRCSGSPTGVAAPATSCGSVSGITARAAARPAAGFSGRTRCTPGSKSTLAQRKVDTGPPVELFLSDGTSRERAPATAPESRPSTPGGGSRACFRSIGGRDGSLGTSKAGAAGCTTFAGDPSLYLEANGQGGAAFRTAPLTDDSGARGRAEPALGGGGQRACVHLIDNLYDEAPDGNRRRITQCVLNPELRHGIATYTVVTPGERYD